jgi:2-polyprenyl-3-methyl-5-hydroxy-6-metoxy-1,4-benzoquinol methylase
MTQMNTKPSTPAGYESKPSNYFTQSRFEMLRFVPPDCRRVLDVGCGKGNFGEALKQSRPVEVWGIEPVPDAATEAAAKLDRVITGMFNPEADLPRATFDAVTFNDVLEHLLDPTAALRLAHSLLRPGGVVVASIPNFRQFQTQWEIVVRGEWRYRDHGILDATHLRFFTKKSIPVLFEGCGFAIEQIEGIHPYWWIEGTGEPSRWLVFKIINALTLNAIEDMKYLQFATVGRAMTKTP